jgi:hypothetical protein
MDRAVGSRRLNCSRTRLTIPRPRISFCNFNLSSSNSENTCMYPVCPLLLVSVAQMVLSYPTFLTGLLPQHTGTWGWHPICIGLFVIMEVKWLLLSEKYGIGSEDSCRSMTSSCFFDKDGSLGD